MRESKTNGQIERPKQRKDIKTESETNRDSQRDIHRQVEKWSFFATVCGRNNVD